MLVMTMTGGGADASRESVDATHTRDPAPQARVRRHGPGDRPIVGCGAQHGRAHPRAGCCRAAWLAAAGDADRPGAGGDALCQRRPAARIAWQDRAGLDPRPSRAAPARRHADAAVGGIPAGGARRLRLQPLVRVVPRLGRAPVADDAAGAPGRRAHVRRLCRPDCRADRRPQRRDP